MATELDLDRGDGRRVRVRHAGRRTDPLVVYLHGSPSSRLDVTYVEDRSEALGVCVASFDRPGYGGSAYTRFTLSSVADDTTAVADALGHRRFAVLGQSSGGAYAVAAAAFHPDRVSALGTGGAGVPYLEVPAAAAQLSDTERHALELLTKSREGKGVDLASVEDEVERMLAVSDQVFMDQLAGTDQAVLDFWHEHLGPADTRFVDDTAFGSTLVATMRESLRQGQQGWARDNVVRMGPWDAPLDRVRAPAWFWYGEEDLVGFGTWLASALPHGQLVVGEGLGHFMVFEQWDEVVTTLARAS